MTKKEAVTAMARAFAALGKGAQANLRWHARAKTRILCGTRSEWFWDRGAG